MEEYSHAVARTPFSRAQAPASYVLIGKVLALSTGLMRVEKKQVCQVFVITGVFARHRRNRVKGESLEMGRRTLAAPDGLRYAENLN